LRQLHLCFGLSGFSPAGKNVQDQIAAVNHFYIDGFFNVIYLCTCQLIIKDDDTNIFPFYISADLFQLSFAHKCSAIRMGQFLCKSFNRYGSGRFSKECQFIQVILYLLLSLIFIDQSNQHSFFFVLNNIFLVQHNNNSSRK